MFPIAVKLESACFEVLAAKGENVCHVHTEGYVDWKCGCQLVIWVLHASVKKVRVNVPDFKGQIRLLLYDRVRRNFSEPKGFYGTTSSQYLNA